MKTSVDFSGRDGPGIRPEGEIGDDFASVEAAVEALRPERPLFCLDADILRSNVARFKSGLGARILYAVKCNADTTVLRALGEAGIASFDAASLGEIEAVTSIAPRSEIFFNHPVKSRQSIRAAIERYSVRHLSIDHAGELRKIWAVDGLPAGSEFPAIHIRIALPQMGGCGCGPVKFGADRQEAADLLRDVARSGHDAGLCFHVGSQCPDPGQFRIGFEEVAKVIDQAGVTPRWINCGGGFPVAYEGQDFPPLEAFFEVIADGYRRLSLPAGTELLCEPGRALVARAVVLVLQVHLRKGDALYLNDGLYGSLANRCCDRRAAFRVRRLGSVRDDAGDLMPFTIFGPTCDGTDLQPARMLLPAGIEEGDWIAIDEAGAYTSAVASSFNGFPPGRYVSLARSPTPAAAAA